MKRGQFTFYRSYFEAVRELNKRDATAVLMAVCAYALDETEPELSGIAKAVFALMRPTLDAGRKRAEGGAKSVAPKENSAGTQKELKGNSEGTRKELKRNSKGTQGKDKANKKEKEGEKEIEKEREIEKEGENECYSPSPVPLGGDAPSRGERKGFGQYGWVKLTDEEHAALTALMGEGELKRCIDYVDESAQKTGNKNGWKDWAVVLTACHRDRWGMRGKGQSGTEPRTDFQPTPERIRANGEWLDRFLEERREEARHEK